MAIKAIVVRAAKPNFWAIQDDESGRFLLSPKGLPIITRRPERAKELAESWMRGKSAEVLDQDRRQGLVKVTDISDRSLSTGELEEAIAEAVSPEPVAATGKKGKSKK